MKVIFLDIDGVLNSRRYDRIRTSSDGNIDISRLPLLKRLVKERDAKIVLTSSWRIHWDVDPALRDSVGAELDLAFRNAGLPIYSKTPVLGDRAEEIRSWLASHPDTESFVILDDLTGGWGDLEPRLVRTSPYIGFGLEEPHITAAIELLQK